MQRKREQELGWEDLTDSAFLPLPQSLSSRYWRASEKLHILAQDGRKPTEIVTFDHQSTPFIQNIGSRYRKRVGRGGRVLLDRLLSRPVGEEVCLDVDPPMAIIHRERWRYDSDIATDLPFTKHPLIVDDFETRFACARSTLIPASEWDSLYPDTLHVEEALRWTIKEPERLPPVQVVGKLPGQSTPVIMQQSTNGSGPMPIPSNIANQMVAVANRAQASILTQQMRRNTSNGSGPTQLHNGNLPLQQPQIRRLMWENGTAV